MPYSLNYGTPFGGPAVGAAVFEAAKEGTDFARSVENNRIMLERRRVAIEDARLAMAKKAEKLEQERWGQEFGQRVKEFGVQAEQWRESRKLQTRTEDRFDREFGERAQERLTGRAETWRQERNGLLSLGGRQVKAGEKLPPGYFSYRDPDGKSWAVPTKRKQEWEAMRDELKKQEAELKLKQQYAPPPVEKPEGPPKYTPWQEQRISNIKGKLGALSGDMERRLRERDEFGARLDDKRAKIKSNLSEDRRRALEEEVARMEKDLAALPTRESYLAERDRLEKELASITDSLLPEEEQKRRWAFEVGQELSKEPKRLAGIRNGAAVLRAAMEALNSKDEAERSKGAAAIERLYAELAKLQGASR